MRCAAGHDAVEMHMVEKRSGILAGYVCPACGRALRVARDLRQGEGTEILPPPPARSGLGYKLSDEFDLLSPEEQQSVLDAVGGRAKEDSESAFQILAEAYRERRDRDVAEARRRCGKWCLGLGVWAAASGYLLFWQALIQHAAPVGTRAGLDDACGMSALGLLLLARYVRRDR